ncbi:MAG: hypothetical protein JWO49_941 [Arthrobacter sp.]|nr:hypothetical protein [Arthrobacter sp.]MCU1547268.1 hypothetical protein [Arthrobacter sp.]
MEKSADGTPRLTATPRHLRRRHLHEDIPDILLVPGAEPLQVAPERTASDKRAVGAAPDAAETAHRRKRLGALLAVLLVVVSVPALVIALLLLG